MATDPRNFNSEIRRRYPVLPRHKFNKLHAKFKAGDMNARDVLVYSNMGLVLGIAWRYSKKGVDLVDLVQAGQKALIEYALPKFKPERGFKFSTYASYWVRHGCAQEIAASSRKLPYPVPAHSLDFRRLLLSIEARLSNKLGRSAREEEVCEEYERQQESRGGRKKSDWLQCWALRSEHMQSMDAPLHADTGASLHDVMRKSEETSNDPEALAYLHEQRCVLQHALERTNPKERAILVARFGLGVVPRTLRELGVEYGVTRERIRQIEGIALRRLSRTLNLPKDELIELLDGLAPSWPKQDEQPPEPSTSVVIDEPGLQKAFATLCEHATDRLGDGHILVKAPERTLNARLGLVPGHGQAFLRAMQSSGWLRLSARLDEAEILRLDYVPPSL
jgi:RNA polymerase primary sigma factor